MRKLELQNETGIPFSNLYSYIMIYDRNIEKKKKIKKNLAIKLQKVMEKNLGDAAALMHEPPLCAAVENFLLFIDFQWWK